jgi:hypothetical protein
MTSFPFTAHRHHQLYFTPTTSSTVSSTMASPIMPLEDFNGSMRQMMTDGFRPGIEATLMKYPSSAGGAGPFVASIARNEEGALGGMAQVTQPAHYEVQRQDDGMPHGESLIVP